VSAALDYHRRTNVPAGGTDEDERRTLETRPKPFKEYGDAARVPVETSVAGRVLDDGAGVIRSRGGHHFRGYSSAGALYPVEAYVVAPEGLYSFDALDHSLVPVRAGDLRPALADAAADDELAASGAIVVLTGIPARTGWPPSARGAPSRGAPSPRGPATTSSRQSAGLGDRGYRWAQLEAGIRRFVHRLAQR